MAISTKNNGGFTIVEMMVAMVIMMVGMLGLLESINIATEYNLKNHLRDEAVYVGEKYMNIQRGKSFALLSTVPLTTGYSTRYEPSRIRGGNGQYKVDVTVTELSTNSVTPSRQIQVLVKWTYKGVEYQNRVIAPVSVINQ